MFQNIKKAPLLIRILIACVLGFSWMFIAANFQTEIAVFGIYLDWIISAVVLGAIYTSFFTKSKNP